MRYKYNLLDEENKALLNQVYKEAGKNVKNIIKTALEEKYARLDYYIPHIGFSSPSIVHAAMLDYHDTSSRGYSTNAGLVILEEPTEIYIRKLFGNNAQYEFHGVYYKIFI